MPRRRRRKPSPLRARRVFLNVPYSPSYERLLVALTTALVTVGAEPLLTFDISEVGEGRLRRIMQAIEECQTSIHDLSYATCQPARFNMPFELGLACAVRQQKGGHEFHVLEAKAHRLQHTLSDVNGIDPKVHHRRPKAAIRAVLLIISRPRGNPSTDEVNRLYEYIWRKYVPMLRQRHGDGLFSRDVFTDLCVITRVLAEQRGLLE